MSNSRLRGLYAITDENLIPESAFAKTVEQALRGGASIIQYRDKSSDESKRQQQASQLRALCNQYAATLIINDDLTLAEAVAADGVHLGENDATVTEARMQLGNTRLIGVSCYNQLQRARDAQAAGADYVAFGAVFSSATKPAARSASCELITAAKQQLSIPVCAIGGIDTGNVTKVIAAGADMAAIISALWTADDIKHSSESIAQLFH